MPSRYKINPKPLSKSEKKILMGVINRHCPRDADRKERFFRDIEIYEMRRTGIKLEGIGAAFNITRERARQVINKIDLLMELYENNPS